MRPFAPLLRLRALQPAGRLVAAWLLPSLFGLAVAAGAALVAWDLHGRALAEAGREVRNTSLILAGHTERTLQGVEMLQEALEERFAASGSLAPGAFEALATEYPLFQLMRDRVRGTPQLDTLSIIDAGGNLLNFARSWPAPKLNFVDREYFTALRDDPTRRTFVSGPLRNRATGAWTFYVARRVSAPDGRFLGVILAAINLDYFQRTFAELDLPRAAAITMFTAGGVLLARQPAAPERVGMDLSATVIYRRTQEFTDGTPVRVPSNFGPEERLISTRLLGSYPIRVSVSTTVEAALAGWRGQARLLAGGTALVLVLLAGAAVMLRRIRLAEDAAAARLAEERARREHALAVQHAEFRDAIEGMSQGLWKFGQDHCLKLANHASVDILGLPRSALRPGIGPGAVLAAAAMAGAPVEALVQRLLGMVESRRRGSFTAELAGARAVAVHHQPLPDGDWIATFEDVTERRAAEARITHMAHHDALTGLANRTLFAARLQEAMAEAEGTPERQLAVLCLDLDQFKAVNDTLGHPVGDSLLRAIAGRLRHRLRAGDLVARLGGDEFAILQVGAEQPEGAEALARRLLDALAEPVMVEGHQVVAGVSIGIALAPRDGIAADALMKRADLALYRAKQLGRGRHALFEPGMDDEARARRALEVDLRRALARSEFELHYQPILETRTRRIAGFEALVRWRHPERGMVPPMEFIPLAEETGLILPLGEWVVRRACADAVAWPEPLRVAVNLSPVQFRSPRLVETVQEALVGSGLRPELLELEVTETVLLNDGEATLATLHGLHQLGVRIAMDDFGTGYSSLSYLRSFPFDKVKIDRSFVRDMDRHPDNATIIRAVTELCCELGMGTTAEGVETEAQLAALEAMRCGEVQGYLFSRPLPAEELPALVAQLRQRFLQERTSNVVALPGIAAAQ